MKTKKVYYIGIGAFGYGIFYDVNHREYLVSRIFRTFEEAKKELSKYIKC